MKYLLLVLLLLTGCVSDNILYHDSTNVNPDVVKPTNIQLEDVKY